MRVAVVYFSFENSKLTKAAGLLAQAIEKQGHIVQLINGLTDTDIKLTSYHYLAVGTHAQAPFSGKISPKIGEFLANCGTIGGKRAYAFVMKKGFFSFRALKKLMAAVEKEGIILKSSDVLAKPSEADYIGSQLHIKT